VGYLFWSPTDLLNNTHNYTLVAQSLLELSNCGENLRPGENYKQITGADCPQNEAMKKQKRPMMDIGLCKHE
jgi:hypothetical protein